MIENSLDVSAEEINPIALQGMINADYVEFMSKFQVILGKYPVVVAALSTFAGEFDELMTSLKRRWWRNAAAHLLCR